MTRSLFVGSVQAGEFAHPRVSGRAARVAETVVAVDQAQWIAVDEREHGYEYLAKRTMPTISVLVGGDVRRI